MSLREEMWRYGKLTGESAEHIPIIQLGAYLDGVDKGIDELEKIKAEIGEKVCHINLFDNLMIECSELYKIIDNHISELKGE